MKIRPSIRKACSENPATVETAFYIVAVVAVLTTLRVVTHTNAVHALIYFIVSLLAVALLFYQLGAPFVAALEVIVYAGAIMVLFLFVIMMLNLGREQQEEERSWTRPSVWAGPGFVSAVLLAVLAWVISAEGTGPAETAYVGPEEVGLALFGPYLIGVQLAALLLLAGLVGASHLRRHERRTVLRDDPVSEESQSRAGPEKGGGV